MRNAFKYERFSKKYVAFNTLNITVEEFYQKIDLNLRKLLFSSILTN